MNGVEVVASWFTPAVLFCVLNLMIGTIFITSTLKPPPTHRQNKEEQPPPPPPPQLVRVPSFFERVKSFNLSRYQSSQPDPALHADVPAQEELHHHEAEEPHHVTRSKSDTVAMAAPGVTTLPTHHQDKEEQPPPPQLVRVPSFFERVKSFNLSRYQSSQPDPARHADVPAQEELHHHEAEEPHHVPRSKSDTVATTLQKSASEKVLTEKEVDEDEERRRPATVRERTTLEDEGVDVKADDFINRFRQQLKLQRLDSLLRYRGAGK